mgnify:CR=1 FL=1
MLNTLAFAQALRGLVGWRPAIPNTGELELAPDLITTQSGLYVNDFSELLRLTLLNDIRPEEESLTAWIYRLQDDALTRLAGKLAENKGLTGTVLLTSAPMIAYPGRAGDTINKLGRFVGIRLKPQNKRGVAYSLPSLSIQLDSVLQQDLPIYLFSESQPEPVQVVTIPAGANKAGYPYSFALEDENAVDVTFASAPGAFAYLGYYEDDLGNARAVNKEFTGGPCGCPGDTWATWGPMLGARAFSMPAAAPAAQAPTRDTVTEETTSFGLNLQFYAYCNTAAVLAKTENVLRLQNVVQLAVALRFAQAITETPNLTHTAQREAIQADAQAAVYKWQAMLYGGRDFGTDSDAYPSMLKGVTLDLSGLDSACQPSTPDPLSVGYLKR